MSLDVYLVKKYPKRKDKELYHANITHNLNDMAKEAYIYDAIWRPYRLLFDYDDNYSRKDNNAEEFAFESTHKEMQVSLIIPFLIAGLARLKRNPEYYKQFNPSNGWGTYENLIAFVEDYLAACKKYPDSFIEVFR